MKKMVGFGDYMLRLNPEGYLRFLQADRFMVNYTGAEANVCVSLAMMGMDTDFVTRLPENDIAAAGVAQLRKFGVGTSHIAYGGERMGVFYVEKGASQRPSKVVYDRKYSSIAQCAYEDFDWEAIFAGASNFHMTGITPALSKTIPQVCIQACKKAKEMGLTISCDLNYRKNLWTEAEAKACMTQLMPYIDILVANEEDAEKVLGFKPANTDITKGQLDIAAYQDVFRRMRETFGFRYIGSTLRESYSASDNGWSAMYQAP